MLIIKDHAVFCVDDATPILQALPTARHAVKDGKSYIAVPHDVEHLAVMRSFGLAAPSPILHRYDWPGRYTPYAHQKHTARFLSENKRSYVLSGMGCIEGEAVISANRRGKTFKITLRDLYHRWTNPAKNSFGNGEWKCRSLKGEFFGLNRITDVLYKGKKPTLRFTLADGKSFRCTTDHNLAQIDGTWLEAGNAKVGDRLVTNGAKMYQCPECSEFRERRTVPRRGQCCIKCRGRHVGERNRGENNPQWKGGRFVDGDGYVRVYCPSHHRAVSQAHVYEHILVAEQMLGKPVTQEYHVHHKNGNKQDNRPENLEVLPKSTHHKHHAGFHHLDGGSTINGGKVVVVPKTSEIVSIEDGGVTDVYDLCMEAPHHNFVVNGVVVHNSGKTSATAWAADFLMREGVVRKMLIAAPLSCLERVWGDELFKNFPHLKFVVLHGSRQTRLDLLKQEWDVAIVNHHGLKIVADHLPHDLDLIIFDELAVLRNHGTALWKAAKKMIKPHHWVWGLTGTPTPNAPTDAWAQSKLITPERYGGSFTRFKVDTMVQLGPFRFLPRRNAEQMVNQVLQPSIRYALEDCIDLPETIYSERDAEMSTEQKHHYEKLRKECATTVNGLAVTAVNAAVLMSKLIQAAVGTVYGDGEKAELDFGPRLEVIKECIEEAGGKVIIFAPLTGYLHALHNKLKKHYKCAVVEGSTSANKRNAIFQEFQEGQELQVLLANPGTMAHGLTLTAAATTIWAAPITSHEIYLQACARIVRPGQRKITNIIHIAASPVERKVYQALKEKSKFQDALLAVVKEK